MARHFKDQRPEIALAGCGTSCFAWQRPGRRKPPWSPSVCPVRNLTYQALESEQTDHDTVDQQGGKERHDHRQGAPGDVIRAASLMLTSHPFGFVSGIISQRGGQVSWRDFTFQKTLCP